MAKNKPIPSKPLRGKTVLITRALRQSGPFKTSLAAFGARVLEFPVIQIHAPRDWAPVDRALQTPSRFDWIIFTSVNGVRYFLRRLKTLGKSLCWFGKLKIAVIGGATRRSIEEKRLHVDLCPERFTSEDLFRALKKKREIRGCHFLLPRTDIAPYDLCEKLKRCGARVTQVTAYRTVPVKEPARADFLRRKFLLGQIDFVTLASSSAVKNFFDQWPGLDWKKIKTKFVSIGPVTSRALRVRGIRPWREAREHTVSGFLEVLERG